MAHPLSKMQAEIVEVIADREYEQASFDSFIARKKGARAAEVDAANGVLCVHLLSGVSISVPLEMCEGLAGVSADRLRIVEVSPAGTGLHFPGIDVDIYVPGLIDGIFGSANWMQKLGQAGGAVKSEAKAAAARENGKRGGRPKILVKK